MPGLLHRARSPQLARLQGQYLPGDLSGLLFCLPLRHRAETLWESGKHKIVSPTTQTVDASGYSIHPVTGRSVKARANKLRIGGGYDMASRRKGAVFEAEGINVLLDSRAFDPASTAWFSTDAPIVTSDFATGIDGTLVADKLEDDDTGVLKVLRQDVTVADDSTWWTAFVHIRKDNDETRFPILFFQLVNGTLQKRSISLNTKTGAIQTLSLAGTTNAYVLDKGTYWKLVVSVKNNGTGNNRTEFRIYPAGGETLEVGFDIAAVGSIIVDAAQLENKEYASTFVETGGAAVTRAKEIVHYSNAAEANCKAAAGTIYFATTPQWEGTEGGQHWVFSLKAANDGVQFFHHQDDGNSRFNVSSGGVAVASLDDGFTLTRGITYIWAMMWAAGNFRLYRDGVLVASDSSGDAPTAMATTIDLGHNASDANHLDGNLAHFHIYDSDHSTARALRNYREIKAWMGV